MNRHRGRPRRGSITVPVLVCFVLIMLISAALIQFVVAERGASRQDERRLQAEWLAEAGLERAAARLAQVGDYAGETWNIDARSLGGRDGGQVTISVEAPKEHPGQRRVTVQADYPRAPEHRVRERRSVVITLDRPAEKEAAR